MATLADYAVGNGLIDIDKIQAPFGHQLTHFFAANPGLQIYSGYRDIERQRKLWEDSDKSGKMVAAPGKSFHNYGQAADLQFNGVRLDRLPKQQQDKLRESAGQFGLEFPMSYEPWHVQPVGAQRGNPSYVPPTQTNPWDFSSMSGGQTPLPGLDLSLNRRDMSKGDWLRDTNYGSDALVADFFGGRNPLKRMVFQKASSIFEGNKLAEGLLGMLL